MKGNHLGEFEELLLIMVLILDEEAYVMKLKDELLQQANRRATIGSLHSTLSRLEKKGMLKSELTGATQERGGRRKRVYQLTADGKAALAQAKELRERLWSQIPRLSLEIGYA